MKSLAIFVLVVGLGIGVIISLSYDSSPKNILIEKKEANLSRIFNDEDFFREVSGVGDGDIDTLKSKTLKFGQITASKLDGIYNKDNIEDTINTLVRWNSKALVKFSGGNYPSFDKLSASHAYLTFSLVKVENKKLAGMFALNVGFEIWVGQFIGTESEWAEFVVNVKSCW